MGDPVEMKRAESGEGRMLGKHASKRRAQCNTLCGHAQELSPSTGAAVIAVFWDVHAQRAELRRAEEDTGECGEDGSMALRNALWERSGIARRRERLEEVILQAEGKVPNVRPISMHTSLNR